MSNVSAICAPETSDVLVVPSAIEVPTCEKGIGAVITSSTSDRLIAGVRVEPIAVWPDDRGHFMEILRVGQGLASGFQPATSQVSGTLTHMGVVKAFHYHLRQFDCWTGDPIAARTCTRKSGDSRCPASSRRFASAHAGVTLR